MYNYGSLEYAWRQSWNFTHPSLIPSTQSGQSGLFEDFNQSPHLGEALQTVARLQASQPTPLAAPSWFWYTADYGDGVGRGARLGPIQWTRILAIM